MGIDSLIRDNPLFHELAEGEPTSWAVSPKVLRFIDDRVDAGMNTLETGAGHTTVAFAIAGAQHTCITPNKKECRKILDYCARIGLQPRIEFFNRSSDIVLSEPGSFPDDLDFIFIDGAHRFPFPCVDFHYTASRLKTGGILGIDDVSMPSVNILYRFLRGEPEWYQLERIGDTAFFERLRETEVIDDWRGQRINRPHVLKRKTIGMLQAARNIIRGRSGKQ